jgi:putative redox protein
MKHEATVRWAGRMTFIGKAGTNHLVAMDTDSDFGGDSSATKPIELLLVALGGCTGMDIVPLLAKMRQEVTAVDLNITAEKSEEHPRTYTRIDIEYVVTGKDLAEDKVKRAIELSQEKYCSVSAMLKKACPVNYTIRIATQRPTGSAGKRPRPRPKTGGPIRPRGDLPGSESA